MWGPVILAFVLVAAATALWWEQRRRNRAVTCGGEGCGDCPSPDFCAFLRHEVRQISHVRVMPRCPTCPNDA